MRLVASLVISLTLAATARAADVPKLEKLVIGYPAPVASLGIIDVMRKAGLFRKHGLYVDLVYIQGSPILTTAMVSGQVPLSFIGGAAIVASALGGADTVYLACGINTLYWRVFSTPEVKAVGDLKGKKIGVTAIGSQEDSVVRYLLRERGLLPDRDFAVVAVGGAPTRLAALSKGVIHASTFIPPQDIAAEKLGLHELIDMSKLGLYNPGSCFASTKNYIKSHRDTVMRVMRAFVEGLRYYKDNRDFVLKDHRRLRAKPRSGDPAHDLRHRDQIPRPRALREHERYRVYVEDTGAARPAREKFRTQRGGRCELHPGARQNWLHRFGMEEIKTVRREG